MVKMDPVSETGDDTLGAKDDAVAFFIVQFTEDVFNLGKGELFGVSIPQLMKTSSAW